MDTFASTNYFLGLSFVTSEPQMSDQTNSTSSSYQMPVPTYTTSIMSTTTNEVSNSTENSTALMSESEQIPNASKFVLIALYTLTTLAALFGNSIAILVFTKGRRSRTDLRLFLINLAIADLIMAIFCIPFTFAYQITGEWMFSEPMCHIVQCCQVVSVTASVSTNTCIGIDRLMAVTFPLQRRVTSSKSKVVVVCVWIFAWSIGIIPLVMTTTNVHDGNIKCEEQWPDQTSQLAYSFFIMILTYFLPVTILTVTYSMVGYQLWNRDLPGNADDNRDAQQLRSKKKVVKMLVTIVLLFGLCWLPLHLFMITITFNIAVFGNAVEGVYFGVHWLSMANSFVNPMVYALMNANFKNDVRDLFKSCCSRWQLSPSRLKNRPGPLRWRLSSGRNIYASSAGTSSTLPSAHALSRLDMGTKATQSTEAIGWKNGHSKVIPSNAVSKFDGKGQSIYILDPNQNKNAEGRAANTKRKNFRISKNYFDESGERKTGDRGNDTWADEADESSAPMLGNSRDNE